MISQLDPMITACKGTYYQEKDQEIKLSAQTISKMNKRPVRIKTEVSIDGKKKREVRDVRIKK